MENSMKEEMYEFIAEFKKIIKINRNKIPDYYSDKDDFDDIIDMLNKVVYNDGSLHLKYIDFLESMK